MAYQLGLVDATQRDRLKKIKTIRDHFVRDLHPFDFDAGELRGIVRALPCRTQDSSRSVVEKVVYELFYHLYDVVEL